ncbi:hypothetical protein COU88_05460 [Candidatus Roizmanbacteria bacterium CG10_big_fil_rev_8_21_14_0_10_39_6]|uniref:Glycosyltransferase RgtA/B/C/D-like domain-containing protein n=1 Tax=Candidatus Roizmanbacteria bacterium CG10_big_fil_rev_8_21_14_0_10_39_6 TaxID=1974853 RepID=A0A2M8KR17_9BACT|nr:MAG: hypothetical protein COU88_05460 [Candidatus Roizmanbacteria bacterium CG10_big_fil_rev_8_21_14_0_10_39_6]
MAIVSLILIFVIFFARLFYPHVSVFYIPDSVNSDVFHVNLSQKIYLSEILKSGHLPFITQDIANGFPLLGESQIGAISIFNLLLYRFLDPIIAFNLTYLLGFIFMGLFLYLLGKHLYQNRFLAYILAISYSFSGIVIMKLTHQGILQSVFLIPVVLYFYIRGIGNFNIRSALIAGFFCGQQFLFGHFFIATGTSINILIMFLYSYITNNKDRRSEFLYFGLFTLSTILVSLPQLVQSYIFYAHSARSAA